MNRTRVSACLAILTVAFGASAGAAPAQEDDVVDFGAQQVGTASAPETFLIDNYFEEFIVGQPFTIDPLVIRGTGAGSFRIERDACSNVFLDIGDDCEFDVVFSPPLERSTMPSQGMPPAIQTAELVMTDDLDSPEAVVQLRGTALRPPRLSAGNPPLPVRFGTVPIGRVSAVRRVVLVAQGGDPGTVTGRMALSGPNADQFALVGEDTCSNRPLVQRQTCYFDVQFKPRAQGAQSARTTISPRYGLDAWVVLAGTGGPPVNETLRQVLTRVARRITAKRLRFGADGELALGVHRWPVDGEISATLSLLGSGKARKRILARSPEAGVVAGDRSALVMHARRGSRRALAKAGKRPRVKVTIKAVEESGARLSVSRKLRVRNAYFD